MKITIVVAATENNVIGINNEMPWHLPDDLKFFKKTTLGKPVLMGKNTWHSIGRPLPGRLNIVLTSSLLDVPEGVLVFKSIDEAFQYLNAQHTPEVCVIGGGQIFKKVLPIADTIFMTRIHTVIEGGEIFFPEIDKILFEMVWHENHPKDEKHAFDFTFQQWVRCEA